MPVAGAIIGSAVLGAGASLLSSKNSSKATDKATAAQVESNAQSLALQSDIYNQNKGVLSPYVNQGYAANNALAGLLGLPVSSTDPVTGAVTTTAAGDPASYRAAFDNYRSGTGYDFRFGEGMKALNTGFAAKGVLNSGAAMKGALNYGQNIASDEFARYMGALSGQQQVGYGAASATAGVGTNFANASTAINGSTADAIGTGALSKAANANNLITNLAGSSGLAVSALSSYGQNRGNGGYYGFAGNGIY